MRRAFFIALLSLAVAAPSQAQRVTVERGDVVYHPRAGAPRRLTTLGRDSAAVLSPDGRGVAFVRATPGRVIRSSAYQSEARELWMVGIDGAGARLLVRGREGASPREVVAGIAGPRFSPDGTRLYFESDAWATSPAIHVVEVRTGRERFVVAGGLVEVVPRGTYAGHLVVGQHRYFVGGGSYDWSYLFTPDSREEGAVADDTGAGLERFRETFVNETP